MNAKQTACLYIESPSDETLPSIWRAPVAVTITGTFCELHGGTSPTGTLAVSGNASIESGLTCAADPGASDESPDGTTAVADGELVDITLSNVTGSPTALTACFEYIY